MTTNATYLKHRAQLTYLITSRSLILLETASADRDLLNRYYQLSQNYDRAHVLAARADFLARQPRHAQAAEHLYRQLNRHHVRIAKLRLTESTHSLPPHSLSLNTNVAVQRVTPRSAQAAIRKLTQALRSLAEEELRREGQDKPEKPQQ